MKTTPGKKSQADWMIEERLQEMAAEQAEGLLERLEALTERFVFVSSWGELLAEA